MHETALGCTYSTLDLDCGYASIGRRVAQSHYFAEGEGLPIDVVAYARGSDNFPHESTVDQFFSESQFESYRRLAEHFAGELVEKMNDRRRETGATKPPSLPELFGAAMDLANPDRNP